MADVHHESVFFTGRVQGVGFRYQTLQVAKGFEVNGWVQNLADGRVQLEVEGSRAEVDAFLQGIEEELDGFIRKIERSPTAREAQFRGFTIR